MIDQPQVQEQPSPLTEDQIATNLLIHKLSAVMTQEALPVCRDALAYLLRACLTQIDHDAQESSKTASESMSEYDVPDEEAT